MPAIDPNDPRQPYEQIADHLRKQIAAGNLKAGDRLPSGRDLAAQFGVAHVTAASALRVLRDEGLAMAWQGRGAFVRDSASRALESNVDSDEAFRIIVNRLDELQTEMQELSQRVEVLEQRRKTRGA